MVSYKLFIKTYFSLMEFTKNIILEIPLTIKEAFTCESKGFFNGFLLITWHSYLMYFHVVSLIYNVWSFLHSILSLPVQL